MSRFAYSRPKFCSLTDARPVRPPLAKKFGPRVCKAAHFMLWSHLMSAQPRSDRRVDQGEDLKKGNTQRTPRTTSMMIKEWLHGSRGSIATRRRSPRFSLLIASGTRPRRRPRVHGIRGAHARLAAASKRPTGRVLLRRR